MTRTLAPHPAVPSTDGLEAALAALRLATGDSDLQVLRGPDAARWGGDDGISSTTGQTTGQQPLVTVPLEAGGHDLGILVHGPALGDRPDLVEAVASAAAALLADVPTPTAEDSIDELRRSRVRLVLEADAVSQRFESGLHDGAQQPLVAVQLILQQVMRAVGDTERLELVERAAAHLRHVTSELRELAHAVPPPVLRERGLSAALTSLAERSAVPVELSIDLEARLPAEVEITGYVVAEGAIDNAASYAESTHVEVTAKVVGGELRLVVTDDGRGGAQVLEVGRLGHLVDRAAALGGTLTVTSPPGLGTVLTLSLPLARPA